MDIKLLKQLGNGVMGTVFLCMYNGSYAIAKMEKFNGDLSSKSNYARQIKFNEFAKKYPNKFMVLLFAGIVNNCIFKQPTPKNIKKWDAKWRNKWLDEQKSDMCSLLVYSPILNCTLQKILKDITTSFKISKKLSDLLFAVFKHLKKSVELMNDAGFYHRDLHPGNIMYFDVLIKTPADLSAKIRTLKIKPDGFYIIDYGAVYSADFETNKNDKQHNKYVQDVYSLIWCLCENPVYWYMEKHEIKLPNYKKGVRFLKNHPIYTEIVKWLPDYVKRDMSIINEMDFLHMICMFLNYDVYCESIDAVEIQKKLDLVGFKPAHSAYYLNFIKNLKSPNI